MDAIQTIAQRVILFLGPEGPKLDSADSAADAVGQALSAGTRMLAIPVERLDTSFFRLSSGLAGEVLQKFVNYGITVAVVGDVEEKVAASRPLADFVRESNRGEQVWFVPDLAALEDRLARRR